MAASGTFHEEKRLGVLDGLRGIAVLLVLWYHIWEISWLPAPVDWLQFVPETGFIGVLLFFFLSGFVISYPFVRADIGAKQQPSWSHFAWRRFTKIVPSYVLSIVVAYALGYAQSQPYASTGPDLLTHLLFVHTWFPQRFGTINGVLWTLAVEVEFYCIFPLVWQAFKRAPWLTAAVMIAVAFAWRTWMAQCCLNTLFATYVENLPGYLDIFAFGMIAAYVYVRFGDRVRGSQLKLAAPIVFAAGTVLLIELLQNLFAFRTADQWQGVWQIDKRPLLGASFALVALGALMSPPVIQLLLDNPPLRFLATISYNLYLYHQLLARELLHWRIPTWIGDDPHYDPLWQLRYTQIAFTATIAQAALVTYLFERPLLRPSATLRVTQALQKVALRLGWVREASAEVRSSKPRSP
jgi:peptidoglycan/LPS O-acetylase OafA/YrhL